jgi:hypothetical protein
VEVRVLSWAPNTKASTQVLAFSFWLFRPVALQASSTWSSPHREHRFTETLTVAYGNDHRFTETLIAAYGNDHRFPSWPSGVALILGENGAARDGRATSL